VLFLAFRIGDDRYAVEAQSVIEVIPLLGLKRIPNVPKGVAGIFNYRGEAVPAIDLAEMTAGQPAAERLSTRILVVRLNIDGCGLRLVGVIAEHATSMLQKRPEDFVETGITPGTVPFLGPVLLDEHGLIQLIQEQKLLSEKLRRVLFAPALTANGTD